jgi:hypothetical protein
MLLLYWFVSWSDGLSVQLCRSEKENRSGSVDRANSFRRGRHWSRHGLLLGALHGRERAISNCLFPCISRTDLTLPVWRYAREWYLLLAVSKPSDSIRVWVQVLLLELYRVLMVVIAVKSILNSHLSSVLRIRIATALGRMMHMTSKDLKRRADTLI